LHKFCSKEGEKGKGDKKVRKENHSHCIIVGQILKMMRSVRTMRYMRFLGETPKDRWEMEPLFLMTIKHQVTK
jgi:hypothetical protein